MTVLAEYTGQVRGPGQNTPSWTSASDILANGGGAGTFIYKGGGNAIDAAVAGALTACVSSPQNCSLGGYGGHMLIYKSGADGEPPLITCIDFNSAAGSLASSNMFVNSLNPTNGHWTGALPPANQIGWKAAGVPGTFAGLFMAQTNYGRKINGTNLLPFAEIMKPTLARVAGGQVTGNAYYTLSSVSNLLMDLYTNSPGYLDSNGNPNPQSNNDPYAVFYSGDIAADIVAAMQTHGGLVTYADMTNYQPREVTPYCRHFSCPNGTPATVYVAPPGSAGISVLQEIAMLEAIGWTNGPNDTWDGLKYWHARSEMARLMWKDHFRWVGDPWGGALPPDILGNGSTNFCDQLLAHVTNGYAMKCPWDTNEILLTNSLAASIFAAVENQTNNPISIDWDDIRYGTFHISTSDKWGNCVSMTLSMGGGFGAQVGVTNRGLVFGQGMALFEPRPGWANSIAPGKRPVDNMSPVIIVPDFPAAPTNGVVGGRAPFAVGAVGGSTIENNIAMQVIKFLTEPPSSTASAPSVWFYNFEGNKSIYMSSYPAGVQSYLTNAGYAAPGAPPSAGASYFAEAWIPPTIVSQPAGTNINSGSSAIFEVTATGLPLFYQWRKDGVALTDGGTISGAKTPRLTVSSMTNGATFSVVITNGAASVTSAPAAVTIAGAPTIVSQPIGRTNFAGTAATFSVTAAGDAPLTYQWLRNGVALNDGGNISGSHTNILAVDSLTMPDAGTYSVVVSNAVGTATSFDAQLGVLNSACSLSLLWSVGPTNGQPWMNASSTTLVPNQRTLAYSALSNHLYVISRSSATTSNYTVYVLNATNGTLLYTLKTNGIQSAVGKSGIGLVGISVADDGAIYACNESNDSSGGAGSDPTSYFRVYRWANANSNTLPSQIFFADPTGTNYPLRWGDNLTVRGAGTNTQILLDMTYFNSFTNSTGSNGYAAILTPSNASLTTFTSRWFITTNFVSTVGRSLEFDGANNAIWQKGPGKALYKNAFDPAASLGGKQIGSTNLLFAANFPAALMGIGLELNRNLAAGVFSNATSTADSLNLYDVSDFNAPVLLSQYNFPSSPRVANGNNIGQTFFKNDLLFTIDANNGIMAFRIVDPAFPFITVHPIARTNAGGTAATFSVSAIGVAPLTFQWRKNGQLLSDGGNISGANTKLLTISNASAPDAGSYSVIVTNPNGEVTSLPATLAVRLPQLIGISVTTNGLFQFGYTNTDSSTFSVYASTNLVQWQWIGSPTQSAPGFFQFTDPVTNRPSRFYQLRSP